MMICTHQKGLTLIEVVLVILLLSIASVAVLGQFTQMARSYDSNEHAQTAAQLAQECAEHIFAQRRLQTYAAAISATCPLLPATYTAAGYARTVSFGAAPGACVTLPCTQVDVVVTHNATEWARTVFMLGSY